MAGSSTRQQQAPAEAGGSNSSSSHSHRRQLLLLLRRQRHRAAPEKVHLQLHGPSVVLQQLLCTAMPHIYMGECRLRRGEVCTTLHTMLMLPLPPCPARTWLVPPLAAAAGFGQPALLRPTSAGVPKRPWSRSGARQSGGRPAGRPGSTAPHTRRHAGQGAQQHSAPHAPGSDCAGAPDRRASRRP